MSTVEIQSSQSTGAHGSLSELRSMSVAGFDLPLLGATIGLLIASLVTINAATTDDIPGSPDYYVIRQGVFACIGLVLMFVVSRIDYRILRDYRTQIYAFLVSSIALVLVVGSAARGSRRWIDVGGIELQPSELGKVLIVLVLAAFITDRARDRRHGWVMLEALGLGVVPALLIFMQPDLGSALVYGAIVFTMLFVGGAHWAHLTSIAVAAIAAAVMVLGVAPAAGVDILKPYQVDRLTSFLSPEQNPGAEGYQQTQAQIAIGAGQRRGRGPDGATQTQLNFLPEHHTDFIFAVVGESFGFAGAAAVMSLYALLLWRVLRILTGARDMFGVLISAGVAAILMFQIFVNVGMNIGIMPITGVTLPLMSYGGSSLIVTFIALGLLQAIASQSFTPRPPRGQVQTI